MNLQQMVLQRVHMMLMYNLVVYQQQSMVMH